ncbi:MAG: hypothetical protein R2756_01355 [Bacteroidales bacterium]
MTSSTPLKGVVMVVDVPENITSGLWHKAISLFSLLIDTQTTNF